MTRKKPTRADHGFTALELSLVLIIFGIVTVTVMSAFMLYTKQQSMAKTTDSLDNSESALIEYVANFGVYPCPSNQALPPTDANYGRERRVVAGDDSSACINTLPPVPGEDSPDPDAVADMVLIGGIPFKSIEERLLANGIMYSEFGDYDTTDGWGRKLTYAVSQNLTETDTYNDFYGAINVVDENDVSLMDEAELDANGNNILEPSEDRNGNGVRDQGRYAHFTLISHGENGRGARTRQGTIVDNCVFAVAIPAPPPPGTSTVNELENCDNNIDGKFLSGLRNDNNNSFNDDIVKYAFAENANLWRFTGLDAVENTNPGRVGIGVPTPGAQLHIGSDLVASNMRAVEYTTRNGTAAMPPEALGGSNAAGVSASMQCPAGQVVTSIQNNTVTCGTPFGSNPPPNMTCPVTAGGIQTIMYGMQNLPGGNIGLLCCDRTIAGSCPGS